MISNIKTVFICIMLICIQSCEERTIEVPKFERPESKRVVLIEELTGVSCPNCPKGSAQLKELKSLYGEQIVIVGIHGDFLSQPTPESRYDFRTEKGAAIENYLKPWYGKPAAAINRVRFPNNEEFAISTPSLWSKYIDEELQKEHEIDLLIRSDFDDVSRDLTLEVTLIPIKQMDNTGDLRLTVLLVEDEIEDAQESNEKIIEEYTHEHVLRDVLTNFDGNPIQKKLFLNEPSRISFKYNIPIGKDGLTWWNPEHMKAIAYIHYATDTRKDILQAVEIPIK